jgi:hypothetical protein
MKKCSYCGRLSGEALTTCPECGTTLPSEHFEPRPARVLATAELQARTGALLGWLGLFWMVLSVVLSTRLGLEVLHDLAAGKLQSATRLGIALFFGLLYACSLFGGFLLFRKRRGGRRLMLLVFSIYALLFGVAIVFGVRSGWGWVLGILGSVSFCVLLPNRAAVSAAASG